MPAPATDQTWDQDTHPPPLMQDPFVFYQPQYHNGLLNASERLNERRIRMALMAYGDGQDSLVKLSPERIYAVLRGSLMLTGDDGEFDPLRTQDYEKHEEIVLIHGLISFRATYADKLVAYCHQKIHPRNEIAEAGSTLVDLNKKP